MELQKKSAILRFCVGLGLCCVKLHHGIASGRLFIGYHKVARETVSRFAQLNNLIVQCHTTLTQFPAELVRLTEDGNKNAYVYACVHPLSFKISP